MANIIVPFDNNPASVVPLTSSGYTVPAGKYAKLSGEVLNGSLLVDGVAIAFGLSHTFTIGSYSTTSTSTSEITGVTIADNTCGVVSLSGTTVSTGNILTITTTFRQRRDGVQIWSQGLNNKNASPSVSETTIIMPGDTFTVQQSAGFSGARGITIVGLVGNVGKFDVWVPAGTVVTLGSSSLAGAAVSGIIQVYNVIS